MGVNGNEGVASIGTDPDRFGVFFSRTIPITRSIDRAGLLWAATVRHVATPRRVAPPRRRLCTLTTEQRTTGTLPGLVGPRPAGRCEEADSGFAEHRFRGSGAPSGAM